MIQEFLSLSVDLKNKKYKSCISQFLEEENYPFDKNAKDGFNPLISEISFQEKIILKSKSLIKKIFRKT